MPTYPTIADPTNVNREVVTKEVPDDLAALENLTGFQLPPEVPDIRDYAVSSEGESIGTVKTLLVSPSTGQVYRAIIANNQNQRFSVPIELLQIDRSNRQVRASFPPDRIVRAPEYEGTPASLQHCDRYWYGGPYAQRE